MSASPRAFDFIHATNDVLKARGVALPLAGQSTTTREDRAAMRTGVVRDAEGTHDELTRLDGLDGTADFDHHAAIFMAHVHGLADLVQPAIGPEIGAADAGRRKHDDGVGQVNDLGFGDLLAADVAWAIKNRSEHSCFLPQFQTP